MDIAGFPNVVRRKEFFCANVRYSYYRYSSISKKKKKEGRFPKSHRKTQVSGKTDTHLGYLYTLDLDSKYLGITWEMGNCTFAIDPQF